MIGLTQELARMAAEEPFVLSLCRAFTKLARADGGAISLGFTTAERTVLFRRAEVSGETLTQAALGVLRAQQRRPRSS